MMDLQKFFRIRNVIPDGQFTPTPWAASVITIALLLTMFDIPEKAYTSRYCENPKFKLRYTAARRPAIQEKMSTAVTDPES